MNAAVEGDEADETVRVWLVERTYSDDEQNVIILVYATPDGERYYRKERALVSFTDRRDTTAAVDVGPESLGRVDDEETRERYAAEAGRMRAAHDPADVV
ncbi:hypothetical protein [Salinigranum marinum]|uniref:hypothetical protein n=1 Tax=Salinigranum marinum TaxID=1515595 RepID=UPI002989B6C1|nr:hypothetical protein [Salinigranum marinum]